MYQTGETEQRRYQLFALQVGMYRLYSLASQPILKMCWSEKVYARVVLGKLQILYMQIQISGYQSNSVALNLEDQLLTLSIRFRKQCRTLYIAFVDLIKAFDLISRGSE